MGATFLPGKPIGDYMVVRFLGEGGFAEVYQVEHRRTGEVYALKVLTTHARDAAPRLLQEASLPSGLRHPNVVRVVDVILAGTVPALLMEFCDGRTLRETLDDTVLDRATALRLFRGIVEGVHCAHAAGLIHRDLKPSNVLVVQQADGSLVPRVADFGLAKQAGSHSGVTAGGTDLGSPAYSAPEQTKDARTVDHRADLYSLGVILYELLLGRSPFAGKNHYETLLAKRRASYPRPRELDPDLDPRLESLIDRLMVPLPDNRLASTDALLVELDGLGVSAPAPAPAAVPATPLPSTALVAIAITVPLVVLVALAAATLLSN